MTPKKVTSIRDMDGKTLHAARVEAAKADISMNEWILRVLRHAVRDAQQGQEALPPPRRGVKWYGVGNRTRAEDS